MNLSPDKLEVVRDAVRVLRDKEREIADLEERLKQLRNEVNLIRRRDLPELFFQAHVDHIGLPAEGNRPPVDAVMNKEYKASIPVNWPPEKRQNAFEVMDDLGIGNLQKITFTVIFESGRRMQADLFSNYLATHDYSYSVKRDVHHASLTAALRELCEQGHVPNVEQLEAIGGYIGTSVDLKVRRDP